MRRSVSLVSAAIVAAAMTACSNDVTAPGPRVPSAPSLDATCRTGFMMSSGRCSTDPTSTQSVGTTTVQGGGSTATTTTTTTKPQGNTCRTGYLLSTGKCSTE